MKTFNVNISLKAISQEEPVAIASKKVHFYVNTPTAFYSLKNVYIVKNLALPLQELSREITSLCENETGIRVQPFKAIPDLLLGQDHCNLIVSRKVKKNKIFRYRCF